MAKKHWAFYAENCVLYNCCELYKNVKNITQNPRHKPHFDVLNRRCIIETE